MKLNPIQTGPGIQRVLCIASLAIALSACGGSSTTDDGSTTDGDSNNGGVSNPDGIDVNGDGVLNAEDDWNFDMVVNQADVDAFNADGGNQSGGGGGDGTPDGNIASDCNAVDCVSANAEWSDNALVSQNRNPISTYALGIQRILYCLNYGGTEDGTAIASYADGIYGPATAADVESYQRDNGLVEDGIVGGQTWEQLQSDLFGPTSFDTEFNSWTVTSAREECNGEILFFQRIAEPMDWAQVSTPGNTSRIPFSINAQ